MELALLIIWFMFAGLTSAAAEARGRNGWAWLVIGLFLGVFGLLLVLVIGRPDPEPQPGAGGYTRDPLETPRGATPSLRAPPLEIYKGYQIRVLNGEYYAGNRRFTALIDAKRWIDQVEGDAPAAAPPANPPGTPKAASASALRVQGTSLFDQFVAGTSNYQPALERLHTARARKHLVTLHCQPDNPHDPNAVAVMSGADILGFLPRDDAADWRDALHEEGEGTADVQAWAKTVTTSDHNTIGLRLDLDWPPELLSAGK